MKLITTVELSRNLLKDQEILFIRTFVGNIDPKVLKPLAEQYLASLPVTNRTETWKNSGIQPTKGNKECFYDKKLETPKTGVLLYYHGEMDYTPENSIYMNVFDDIMNIVYTEKIREDEGGTYGVHIGGQISKYPQEKFGLQIFFETNEELYKNLIKIAQDELNSMATNGPSEVNLNKVKEFMLKKYQEDKQENSFWMGKINEYTRYNIDSYSNYEKIVNSITVQSMADFAKKILAGYKKEIVQIGK